MAAQALGVSIGGMETRDAALAAADAVEKLMKAAGHPMKLSEVGVTEDLLDLAALHAIADTPTLFNARPVTDPAEVAALYKEVF